VLHDGGGVPARTQEQDVIVRKTVPLSLIAQIVPVRASGMIVVVKLLPGLVHRQGSAFLVL
jgi:hypothetical protein